MASLNKGLKRAWCVIHKISQGSSKSAAQKSCGVTGGKPRKHRAKTRRRRSSQSYQSYKKSPWRITGVA